MVGIFGSVSHCFTWKLFNWTYTKGISISIYTHRTLHKEDFFLAALPLVSCYKTHSVKTTFCILLGLLKAIEASTADTACFRGFPEMKACLLFRHETNRRSNRFWGWHSTIFYALLEGSLIWNRHFFGESLRSIPSDLGNHYLAHQNRQRVADVVSGKACEFQPKELANR